MRDTEGLASEVQLDAWRRAYEAVAPRIDAGIREYRMSDCTLRLTDDAGHPLVGRTVKVTQQTSAFLFGANIFMLGGYPTQALNAKYEQAFVKLFNAATVPLYWKGLEPVQGQPRFSADSQPVFRRPPVDPVVAFCEKHRLNMNGHCLVWDNVRHAIPEWLTDTAHCEALLERRIRELGERYGNRIQRWDVLNEPLNKPWNPTSPNHCDFPLHYERVAFKLARQYLPAQAHLMINETIDGSWLPQHRPRYHRLITDLLEHGADIRGIGLQWHYFSDESMRSMLDGKHLPPEELLKSLDEYQVYQRPLHISEITLHSLADDAAGRDIQACIARLVYRLWFSHPAVHAITWWNLPDGGAVPGEDKLASGLLDRQLDPKPAYDALDQLINHEWRSDLTLTTDAHGSCSFRGFHGQYRVGDIPGHVSHEGGFDVLPGRDNCVHIRRAPVQQA